MSQLIIGVDCATKPSRTGLARAEHGHGGWKVTDLRVCDGDQHPVELVVDWLQDSESALLALDAPLGWPAGLGRALGRHSAGEPVMVPGHLLFRRLTDRVVAEQTGKTPLDVGADRIARTAHSALLFLDHVRMATAEPIPLAWDIPLQARVEAIEVYPAATMLVRGGSLRGYKKPKAESARTALLEILTPVCDFEGVKEAAVENHDCLDALACVVAGIDFLEGKAVGPKEPDIARREGWIWFREPGRV